jgi:S1-C subfamily serine protease
VINGATKISVTDVGNGKTYSANVVGYDASHDVAVLQLQGASGLTTAKLGDSSSAADGDELGGTSEQLQGLIETNANIQPGDSGGPLVNTNGEVIGIDTAASQGFTFQSSANQGYAVPINDALTIAHQIESGKGSTTTHVGATAFLGVQLSSSANQGSSNGSFGGFSGGSGSSNSGTSGAPVSGVLSGGPAAQAGLASGDFITSLGGQSVDSATTISAILVGHHPGDKVQIGWVDSSGQSHTATVTLGSGPPA